MTRPSEDETRQTFELLGMEILHILVSLDMAPRLVRESLRKLLGHEPASTYDFDGAKKALYDQRSDMGLPAHGGAPKFRETVYSVTLQRRLWVACYHALVWARPAEAELRLKITLEPS